jgi:phospholipid/cholesterol/gamma-HCH transport system substrate-binding protein
MAKPATQKVKVGILVIVGTLLLIDTLYFIGRQQSIFGNNIKLYAIFDNVNGLQIGNNVRYSGTLFGN